MTCLTLQIPQGKVLCMGIFSQRAYVPSSPVFFFHAQSFPKCWYYLAHVQNKQTLLSIQKPPSDIGKDRKKCLDLGVSVYYFKKIYTLHLVPPHLFTFEYSFSFFLKQSLLPTHIQHHLQTGYGFIPHYT